jgi:folate-dependent phosphoribosylglycinamide formyltransferase PurN
MRNNPLVTLHGYLRILPEEVVTTHEVINGHPGDIIKYPELKGKDPQAKAIDLGLPSTGVVLHKAVAEVDAGEILKHQERTIHAGTTTEQLILDLKALQLNLWCDLLRERL